MRKVVRTEVKELLKETIIFSSDGRYSVEQLLSFGETCYIEGNKTKGL